AGEASRTLVASPAADLEGHDHPIARTETAHGAAGLDDLRDELVAERKGPRERHEAVHDGVVDVARRDDERAHERVVRRLEACVRSLLPSHRTGLDERQLSHARVPRRETLAPAPAVARARGPCHELVPLACRPHRFAPRLVPGLRPIAPQRRLLLEPAHLRGDRLALAAEERPHRVRQPAVDDEVHALGGAWLEAAELLVLAACPGLEAMELRRDAVLYGRVVADVEVEVAKRAHRTPVATVQRVALLHVERAGDHLASLARHDQAEPVAQALSGQLEEAVIEVL